jgi:hypothetical protein
MPWPGLSKRGQWPASALDLPLFLTPEQLAYLLDKSVRTLERDRHMGRSIPYRKVGRTVLYARDDVLEYLRQSRTSACEPELRLQRPTANRDCSTTEPAP